MTDKTYTLDEVKTMLDKSMKGFQSHMILLVRECAVHRKYRDMTGQEALKAVADRLEGLK